MMLSQTVARHLGCVLLFLLPIISMQKAQGQPFDYVLSACNVQVQPSNELLISITLDVDAPGAIYEDPCSNFDIPVRILFNGASIEPDQLTEVISGRLAGNLCPAENPDHTCNDPAGGACGRTWYRDKEGQQFTIDWGCLHNWNTHDCDCVKPGQPAIHKLIPLPNESGTFTILLDPDNLAAETDETNNECEVGYTLGSVPTVSEWGMIIMTLLLLTVARRLPSDDGVKCLRGALCERNANGRSWA